MLAAVLVGACQPGGEGAPSLDDLIIEEQELLARGPDSRSAEEVFGSDPFRIDYLPGLDRYLVLLRNASEVLLCDNRLRVLDRQPAPRSPTGWGRDGEEQLFVAGELSSSLSVYRISADRLQPRQSLRLGETASVRDLVYLSRPSPALFLLDGFDRRLVRLELESGRRQLFPLGAGPVRILHRSGHLIINLLQEHSILVLPLQDGIPDFDRASRIRNQGPFWSLDAAVQQDRLILAAGGIEDLPLDRSGGEFGNVDSFLFTYQLPEVEGVFRWDGEAGGRQSRFNLSELGVVTPKALKLVPLPEGGLELWVTGFGADKLAQFRLQGVEPRLVQLLDIPPGVSDIQVRKEGRHVRLALANTLLDRSQLLSLAEGKTIHQLAVLKASGERSASARSRLGEILFFTTLLAPNNSSQGPLSRLSCEACHFEGAIDGRIHYTGRQDIHATTKTLRGLARNVPLFSRAGDESLSSMVLAEFRVANQGSQDIFELRPSHHPWLKSVQGLPDLLTPLELRRAFLAFFVDFEHRPNPWRLHRKSLDEKALGGLEVFRKRCEDCHQAVDSTRQGKAVPFDQWRDWLESQERDLIWGAPFYSKTGIRPYVDPAGARVPSLRRVWLKYPYFTNGSSKTIREVLERFRYQGSSVWHHHEPSTDPPAKALTEDEIDALQALLRYF
ncbi:MAG: hypothetical protein V3T83_11745 [Acidobacteriota bacterium]